MTLPNEKIETVLETIRLIHKRYGVKVESLAVDAGVSHQYLRLLLKNPGIIPGKYVDAQLRKFVEKLRQEYPQEVK